MTTTARLAEAIANAAKIDLATAAKVADYYVAQKIAKIDCVHGGLTLAHGAFLDADVIHRAAQLLEEGAS